MAVGKTDKHPMIAFASTLQYFHASTLPVADVLDRFPSTGIGVATLGVIAALTVYVLSVNAIKVTRDTFGRKPPLDEDLARHNATIQQIKSELAMLAPNEKLQALVEKLGSFATLQHLAEVKLSFIEDLKEVRSYMREEMDAFREMIAVWQVDAKMRSERIAALEAISQNKLLQMREIKEDIANLRRDVHDRINVVGDRVGELVGEMRSMSKRS